MNTPVRHNPLVSLEDDEDAIPAPPPAPKPVLPKEEKQRIAQSFIGDDGRSKPAPAVAAPARKQRRHTTGRNKQINLKASDATIDRLYRQADDRQVSLAELLEIAVDLLEQYPKK